MARYIVRGPGVRSGREETGRCRFQTIITASRRTTSYHMQLTIHPLSVSRVNINAHYRGMFRCGARNG